VLSGQAIAQSGEPMGKLEISTLVNNGVQHVMIEPESCHQFGLAVI
jgi:hypothetical protein